MTFRYYLRHCLWGLVSCGSLVYNILTDLNDGEIFPSYVPYMPYVAAYLMIGAISYPFAYYVVETTISKKISKQAWERNFSDIGASWSVFIFVCIFCILFNIPLLALYFYIAKNTGKS
ncbi:hypothetical protein ZQ65_01455 [Salmonella enterica subsp. enterica serovar Newport]|uniref:Colicin transporter n=1 Tax=Salmonella newport TaxID=108619 RepID=A0A5U9KLX9_SALNE|nr:hypothetical protein [Salmonella enterica subsp. enterica]EBS2691501.1 hypothetical protein [Salmonella enterica subsp. enterica serovar Newport]EDX0052024.1 hypothetical protein [Salmonella enterica]ECN8538433.1 hypothetical protein [Salmonella enterica subsp. enterica serovar Newport]EGF7279305.1 hypothetical protein [Salmonella enterica]